MVTKNKCGKQYRQICKCTEPKLQLLYFSTHHEELLSDARQPHGDVERDGHDAAEDEEVGEEALHHLLR